MSRAPVGDESVFFRDDREAGGQTQTPPSVSHGAVVNTNQETFMNTHSSNLPAARSKIALLMVLCGIAGGASAGAVAAVDTGDVPTQVVRYQPDTLASDAGARVLYRRIVKAAEIVCPASSADRFFLSNGVRACREEAVARAVHQIDSPRLAALHAASAKSG